MDKLSMLTESKNTTKLTAIYTDVDDLEKFAVGIIVACNNKHFILSSVTRSGSNDGLVLFETDSIIMQEFDSKYINKIKILCNNCHFKPSYMPCCTDNLLYDILLFAKENQFICSIELNHTGYYDCIGTIINLDDSYCTLNSITADGESNGVCYIPICNITKISCNSEDEQTISILYNYYRTHIQE